MNQPVPKINEDKIAAIRAEVKKLQQGCNDLLKKIQGIRDGSLIVSVCKDLKKQL